MAGPAPLRPGCLIKGGLHCQYDSIRIRFRVRDRDMIRVRVRIMITVSLRSDSAYAIL